MPARIDTCPKCGRERPEVSRSGTKTTCPHCGAITFSNKQGKHGCLTAFLVVVGFCILMVVIGSLVPDTASNSHTYSRPAARVSDRITYTVSGSTQSASVTYSSGQGATSQRDVIVPWTSAPIQVEPGDFLYISAQNTGNHGTITVKIMSDGMAIRQSTSSGAYAIATASGSW